MSERALMGPRILTKDVDQATFTWDGAENKFVANVNAPSTWQGHAFGIYWEGYFDLSGYNLDDLTLVPTLMELQDSGIYQTTFFPVGPTGTQDEGLFIVDVMSQEKLNIDDTMLGILTGGYPSTNQSSTNFEQIPMCNVRFTRIRTTYGANNLQSVVCGGSYGSGEPTAGEKLYLYRFIVVSSLVPFTGPEGIIAYPTRFILGANIIKEEELAHMMRLKRSYELANYGN
jgi:hypothetical protein